jgi:hypothetical protein
LEVGSDFQLTSYFHFEVQTSNFPTSDFQRQTSNFLQAFSAQRISSARSSRRRSRIDQICPHVAHPRYTKLPDGAIATAVGRLQFSRGVFLRMTGTSMIRLLIHLLAVRVPGCRPRRHAPASRPGRGIDTFCLGGASVPDAPPVRGRFEQRHGVRDHPHLQHRRRR